VGIGSLSAIGKSEEETTPITVESNVMSTCDLEALMVLW